MDAFEGQYFLTGEEESGGTITKTFVNLAQLQGRQTPKRLFVEFGENSRTHSLASLDIHIHIYIDIGLGLLYKHGPTLPLKMDDRYLSFPSCYMLNYTPKPFIKQSAI
jgi:hypothetical protein